MTRHPRRLHAVRSYLAKTHLGVLILQWFACVLVLASFVAFLYLLLNKGELTYSEAWYKSTLSMFGMDSLAANGFWAQVLSFLVAGLAVLFPSLLLGAIVYRVLFVRRIFEQKAKANVIWSDKGYQMTVRIYNNTPFYAVDCEFRAYLRQAQYRGSDARYVTNAPLELDADVWPVSQPGVPYSVRIRLQDGDLKRGESGKLVLRSIQGNVLEDKWRIALVAKAAIPDLGLDITDLHWVKSGHVSFADFKEILVDYDTNPKNWEGWDEFEKDQGETQSQQFVFGYGSLTELVQQPTRAIDTRGFIADLSGYRRSWNVAMDNSESIRGYKYYEDIKGERPEVFVAFLNIVEAPDSQVNGVCVPVSNARLKMLDQRERNYRRIDVTDRLGAKLEGRVWAYVGTDEAEQRALEGASCGRLLVQEEYIENVENGFRGLGDEEMKKYKSSTESIPEDSKVEVLVRRDLPM